MKKLLPLCLALLAINVPSWAQTKKPPQGSKAAPATHRQSPELEGLGRFKIGKTTTAVIGELCRELNVPLEHAYSVGRLTAADDSAVVIQVDYELREEYPDASSFGAACPDAAVYYVPNYTIAEIPVKGLRLSFYKGLLVEIEAKGEIASSDAFAVKYGKPEERSQKTAKPCASARTRSVVTYDNETLTSTWFNKEITATQIISEYRDRNCERQVMGLLLILDNQKTKALDACNTVAEKARLAKLMDAKKKKLSDL